MIFYSHICGLAFLRWVIFAPIFFLQILVRWFFLNTFFRLDFLWVMLVQYFSRRFWWGGFCTHILSLRLSEVGYFVPIFSLWFWWGFLYPHKCLPLDFLRWVILFHVFTLKFWWGDFFLDFLRWIILLNFFSPDFGEVIFFTHIFSLDFLRWVFLLLLFALRFSEVSYFAPIFS